MTIRTAWVGSALAALLCAGLTALLPAKARAWPERTVTIVVHFPAGGSTDVVNRMIGNELSAALKQPVVVENRPGGGGSIGVLAVTRAAPDGYTILSLTSSPLVNAALNKVQYDAVKELTGVAYLGATPNVIVTNAKSGIESFADLVAKAKANPGKLNYVSPGIGTVGYLAMEMLKKKLGIDIVHVPTRGMAPAYEDLTANRVELASFSVSGTMTHVESGAFRPLLQTGSAKWPELPNVPTVKDVGVPDAEMEIAYYLAAPAGTPADIVERLSTELVKIMGRADLREKLLKMGFGLAPEGAAQTTARVAKEQAMWHAVAAQTGPAPQ